jgi:hypothetical protein
MKGRIDIVRQLTPQSLCNVSLRNEPVDPRTRKTSYPPGVFSLTFGRTGELCEKSETYSARDGNYSVGG